MKFKFSFYLDKRFKYENGEHSIKVNCYSYSLKKQYHFRIKPLIFSDGSKFIVSCKNQKEFESVWLKKDKLDNFGEKIGETTVYGDKLKLRTILKDKQDQLNDIISKNNIITIADVKEAFYNYVKPVTFSTNVYTSFENYINDLKKFKTASSYRTTLNNIFRHNNPKLEPSKDLYKEYPFKFEQVTVEWLKQYEETRRKDGISVNSVAVCMRNIKAVYNNVASSHNHLLTIYPFGSPKRKLYQIPNEIKVGRKNSLDTAHVTKLMNFKSDNFYLQMARDYWIYSYINRGMNLKDIALLKKGQTEFYRHKTKDTAKKVIKGKIQSHPILDEIIDRHSGTGKYLFDIIEDDCSDEEMTKMVDNKTSRLNKQYKKLAKELDLPSGLSFQWARHSYSTNMIRGGININVISEQLNHTDIRTTQNYINSLVDEEESKINKILGL